MSFQKTGGDPMFVNQSNIGIHGFEICSENENSESFWFYQPVVFFLTRDIPVVFFKYICLVCASALLTTTKNGNFIFTCTCILSLPFSNIAWYMYLNILYTLNPPYNYLYSIQYTCISLYTSYNKNANSPKKQRESRENPTKLAISATW